MRIGADQCVGIGLFNPIVFFGEHDTGEIIQIDLMYDAGTGGYHLEVGKRLLAPSQECITFFVAIEFDCSILCHRIRAPEHIHLNRVVNHQFCWRNGINASGIATEFAQGITHGGKVDNGGHTSEVLHQYAGRRKRNLTGRLALGIPRCKGFNVVDCHIDSVFTAQKVFEQDLQ